MVFKAAARLKKPADNLKKVVRSNLMYDLSSCRTSSLLPFFVFFHFFFFVKFPFHYLILLSLIRINIMFSIP